MDHHEMTQILQSIAKSHCGLSLVNNLPLGGQLDNEQAQTVFCEAVGKELGVKLTVEEVKGSCSLADCGMLVETRLSTNESGQKLVDIYSQLERLAKEEFHPHINYHWCAKWDDFLKVGNWFTRPEGLDTVEIVIRMEEYFNIKITDDDAASLNTVGQTVRYVWEKMARSDTRDVAAEQVPKDTLKGVFNHLKEHLLKPL